MKKSLIFAAVAAMTFAGCSSDDYVGDNAALTTPPSATSEAILFSGGTNHLTRATSNEGSVPQMLDGQMKIYGVKNVSSTYSDVFKNYLLWSTDTRTSSNPDGDWEYVGADGTHGTVSLDAAQTIKYWDYSAANYHFVAGSPVSSFTYNLTSGDITTATVTGIAGHITAKPTSGSDPALTTNPVYIADPVNVSKTNYKNEVQFSFKRQQSFVRVGIYETIPGYSISEIHFYKQGTSDWETTAETSQNIILASKTAGYFAGSSNATATVTYNWTTPSPSYTFSYTGELTSAKNWYGGAMDGVKAKSSTEATTAKLYGTDKDMAANGYFTVIPSASALVAQPILIKCDYTLKADDNSGETIQVTGATAAIPSAFTIWEPNTSYTYLFKISDNTNGSTGDPSSDEEGLYPITFDAVVAAEADGTKLGNITSVTTPSITTYQEGSVTAEGIKYVKDKPIYFTAQNDENGSLYELTTGAAAVKNVQVFRLAAPATEADLQVTAPAPATSVTTAIVPAATTVGKWTIPAKSGSFTPDAAGYYAIQYQTATTPAAAYTYKIVHVEE